MSLAQSLSYRLSLDVFERLEGALSFAAHLERMRLTPEAEVCAGALAEMVRDARDVVASAIDLKRAQAGALELHPTPVRLRDLVDRISDVWLARARRAGVTLLTAYDGQSDLTAEIDSDRLFQCIEGLVGHAISRGGGGAIEAALSARPDGDMIAIEVSVRDGSPAARDHSTVGGELGLAVARELVGALGGLMRGGDNAGAGATWGFRLRAPVAKAAQPERTAPPATLAHVLIVDDNATNRMVAEALCEGFDCTSETACDGLEAIEAVRRRAFDVVLMDIKMPNMDGLEATAVIRATPGPLGSIPILAMTANADPGDIARYLAAGMQGVVEKPIKPEQLARALNAALSAPRSDAESATVHILEA